MSSFKRLCDEYSWSNVAFFSEIENDSFPDIVQTVIDGERKQTQGTTSNSCSLFRCFFNIVCCVSGYVFHFNSFPARTSFTFYCFTGASSSLAS